MSIMVIGASMYNWAFDAHGNPVSWLDYGTTPDIRQMNKTSLGRVNIVFALVVAGHESSFGFGKFENTAINAHLSITTCLNLLIRYIRTLPCSLRQ